MSAPPQKSKKGKNRWRRIAITLLLLVAIVVAHPIWLEALGRFLIVSDPLTQADAILVLSGDIYSNLRLLHAAELWRAGYAPQVVLSAPMADWQTKEDHLPWRFARKKRLLPEQALVIVPHQASSTLEEAEVLIPFVREKGYRSIILVTSNFHTRRSQMVFRRRWGRGGIRVIVSAAPSWAFDPNRWWTRRTDSRTFLLEWTKIFWYFVER